MNSIVIIFDLERYSYLSFSTKFECEVTFFSKCHVTYAVLKVSV